MANAMDMIVRSARGQGGGDEADDARVRRVLGLRTEEAIHVAGARLRDSECAARAALLPKGPSPIASPDRGAGRPPVDPLASAPRDRDDDAPGDGSVIAALAVAVGGGLLLWALVGALVGLWWIPVPRRDLYRFLCGGPHSARPRPWSGPS